MTPEAACDMAVAWFAQVPPSTRVVLAFGAWMVFTLAVFWFAGVRPMMREHDKRIRRMLGDDE